MHKSEATLIWMQNIFNNSNFKENIRDLNSILEVHTTKRQGTKRHPSLTINVKLIILAFDFVLIFFLYFPQYIMLSPYKLYALLRIVCMFSSGVIMRMS